MAEKLVQNTELHVQQLLNESYLETDMEPQGSAGVELCVYMTSRQQLAVFFV
jgi:hypothetical protein